MDLSIRREFRLSEAEYTCLLRTLRARFGVEGVHEMAFLSAEQLAGVTDGWEATAVRRLTDIVVTHVGVEKLWRESSKASEAIEVSEASEASETQMAYQ
jgi:hypothetical protein